MYKINGNRITLVRGDSFYANLSLIQAGSQYDPQEGDVIKFGMKKDAKDAEALIVKTIPNDTLLLHIYPEDTKELPLGSYVYDIEVTLANGDVDTVINNADFILATEVI